MTVLRGRLASLAMFECETMSADGLALFSSISAAFSLDMEPACVEQASSIEQSLAPKSEDPVPACDPSEDALAAPNPSELESAAGES